ncbi:MAG: CpsB/CapC family capsule biosynthesis tyrosine phosphatase [Thermotaleaceae bacterium]
MKMIDIHCHILPDVDDGAKDWEEAIEMAKIARDDGIHTIISTSHYLEEADFVMGEALKEHVANFNQRLKIEGIDVKVLLGNEAYLTPDLVKDVQQKKVFTINESRYLLVEFPMHTLPFYTEDVLYALRLEGIVPIIAHPERYAKVIENPMVLYPMIVQGALVQVNGGSLLGNFGKKVEETCKKLLSHNMVHFIGSDGHSPRRRRPELSKALGIAGEILGKEKAWALVQSHGQKVLADQDLKLPEPLRIKEKGKINFFTDIFKKISL